MTDPDKERGLYGKYYVVRADGTEKEGSRYFVLDYGNDSIARRALLEYATTARYAGYGQLSEDLLHELKTTTSPDGGSQ